MPFFKNSTVFEIVFNWLVSALLILSTTIFDASCLHAQEENSRASYPVAKSSEIRNLKLSPGRHEVEFTMTNKKTWKINISIPEIKDGYLAPLILALHWAGGSEASKDYSECLAFPAFESSSAIIVAPSADGSHWVDPALEHKVVDLLRKILKYWPVDRDKTIVTGYSNGAIGSWQYAHRYPKLFCAAIPIAGSYNVEKIEIPLYLIHGQNDELFPLSEANLVLEASKEEGSKIVLTILPNMSHYMGCSYADALKEMATMVLSTP